MTHHGYDGSGSDGALPCAHVQLALSARLDGEISLLPTIAVDEHLDGCVACGTWLAGAQRVDLAMRWADHTAPDLSARVLTAVAADRARSAPPRERFSPRRLVAAMGLDSAAGRATLRWAVGLIAVTQLMAAIPILVGVLIGDAHGMHASREMASFDVAMAVGFLLAALRPAQARAFVPVAFILATCLAMTSSLDLINGRTMLIHELSHLVAIVQGVLLWLLGRSAADEPEESGLVPPVLPAR
jgi:predicted anti-sigma-YlaC factor YlaD